MPRGFKDAFMRFWSCRPRHCRSCGRRFYERYYKNQEEQETTLADSGPADPQPPEDAAPAAREPKQAEASAVVKTAPADAEPEPEPKETELRCPHCFSRDIGYTRQRTTGDAIMGMFRRIPKRCRACGRRFYVAQWTQEAPEPEPQTTGADPGEPASAGQYDTPAAEPDSAPAAETAGKSIRCPRCHSRDLAISVKRGMWDGFLGIFHLEPRRCRVCSCRFHVRIWESQEPATEPAVGEPAGESHEGAGQAKAVESKAKGASEVEAVPGEIRCPHCRSKDLARPLRSGFGGAFQAILRREPRVCRQCGRHFYTAAPGHHLPDESADLPPGETPET